LKFAEKTVLETVAESFSGICAACHTGKTWGLTGIPGTNNIEQPFPIFLPDILDQEEAVAGGADIGAGAAAHAGFTRFFPGQAVIFIFDKRREILQGELKALVDLL
jgi:hypothetical protein